MAQVTLNPQDTLTCLISLLNKLAQAISWVSQQEGSITLELPDRGDGIRPLNDPSCYPRKPAERTEADILIEILTKMRKKGLRRPKAKPRT